MRRTICWGLVLEAARLDDVVDQSVRTLELSVLAKYAFGLAQTFNGFYHKYSILNEEREDARLWRAAAVAYLPSASSRRALELMGCVGAGEDVASCESRNQHETVIGITPLQPAGRLPRVDRTGRRDARACSRSARAPRR